MKPGSAVLHALEVRVSYGAWCAAWAYSTPAERAAYGIIQPPPEAARKVADAFATVPADFRQPVLTASAREFERMYDGPQNRTAMLIKGAELSTAARTNSIPVSTDNGVKNMDSLDAVTAIETANIIRDCGFRAATAEERTAMALRMTSATEHSASQRALKALDNQARGETLSKAYAQYESAFGKPDQRAALLARAAVLSRTSVGQPADAPARPATPPAPPAAPVVAPKATVPTAPPKPKQTSAAASWDRVIAKTFPEPIASKNSLN